MRPVPDFNPQPNFGGMGGADGGVPQADLPLVRGHAGRPTPEARDVPEVIRPAGVVGRHALDGAAISEPSDVSPAPQASASQPGADNEGTTGDVSADSHPPQGAGDAALPSAVNPQGVSGSETTSASPGPVPAATHEAGAARPDDPNTFTSVDVWYDEDPLPVTSEEQAALAEKAAQYHWYAPEVERLAAVDARSEHPRPDDDAPLGEGLDATAYDGYAYDKHYVVRFAKGEDVQESTEMTKLRLVTLARTEVEDTPHLERLVTYDIPLNAVVTEMAEGTPANELSPDDIAQIPSEVLTGLQETAEKMERAKVALDIKWGAEGEVSEDPLEIVVSNQNGQAGPTYYDLTNIESYRDRPNEAGRHYAELVTTMVATGHSLDPDAGHAYRPLTYQEVTSRIKVFDEAYRAIQDRWPDSSGAGWLARTAGRMIQTLSPGEQAAVMAQAGGIALPLGYRDEQ